MERSHPHHCGSLHHPADSGKGVLSKLIDRLDRPPIAVYRCSELLGDTAALSGYRERSIGSPGHVVSDTSSFVRVITRASSLGSEVGELHDVVSRTYGLGRNDVQFSAPSGARTLELGPDDTAKGGNP